MLQKARKDAYKLIILQIAVAMLLFVVWWWFKDFAAGISAILGAIACIIPSIYFVHKFFSKHERTTGQIIRDFYIGELVKLFMSAIFLVLIVKFLPVQLVAVVIGYVAAYLSILLYGFYVVWK
ncbi:MAG: ATP synthase subunit I [Gammaproteobacteria bacterium]|nr:ATP synthase subunit I [Gammaproteobacteria bacterium]